MTAIFLFLPLITTGHLDKSDLIILSVIFVVMYFGKRYWDKNKKDDNIK